MTTWPRPRLSEGEIGWLGRALVLAGLIVAWSLTTSEHPSPGEWPGPIPVGAVLAGWLGTGRVWPHLAATLESLLLGLTLGTAVGAALGVAMAYVPWLAVAGRPLLAAINGLPRAALVPLFILWFGFGLRTEVALATLLILFYSYLLTYGGLLGIEHKLTAHVRLLGAGGISLFGYVYAPAVGIWILAGLRAAVGLAFTGVIVGEYFGATRGLGYLLANAMSATAYDEAVAALILIAVVGLALSGIASLITGPAEERALK